MSDLFTSERKSGFESYHDQPEYLLAYGLFYFPQTFVRTQMILKELLHYRKHPLPTDRPLRVLDVGAGTVAATFALTHELGKTHQLNIEAVDLSSKSLDYLKKISQEFSHLWPQTLFATRTDKIENLPHSIKSKTYDIILASFSLNEAFYDKDD